MQTYANNNGDSNIIDFEIGNDFIVIEFKSGANRFYKYTYSSAGSSTVEHMKSLARSGSGLKGFISSNRPQYSEKW